MGLLPRTAASLLLASCYEPTIQSGTPCVDSSECPNGVQCIANVCGGTERDAGRADDAPDAFVVPFDGANVTLTIGANASQLRDTEIWVEDPNTNFGGDDHFSVDNNELGLVWFDLTSISTSTVVVSAVLELHVADEASEDAGTVEVYRMREAWEERGATYVDRTPNQAWSATGAQPPSRDETPLATAMPSQINSDRQVVFPAGVVQTWISNPAENFGIAVVRGTSMQHVHFGSRESGKWTTLTLELRTP